MGCGSGHPLRNYIMKVVLCLLVKIFIEFDFKWCRCILMQFLMAMDVVAKEGEDDFGMNGYDIGNEVGFRVKLMLGCRNFRP